MVNVDFAVDFIKEVKNTKKIEVDGDQINNEKELIQILHDAFEMPSKYALNENGIIDGLKDLSWFEKANCSLIIWNENKIFKNNGNAANLRKKWLFYILGDEITNYWLSNEKHLESFSVLLVNGKKPSKNSSIEQNNLPGNIMQYLNSNDRNEHLMRRRLDSNSKIIQIDGQKCSNKRSFYFEIAEQFSFPNDFVYDADESHFIDCMRNLKFDDLTSNYVLYVDNTHKKAGKAMHNYISTLFNENILPYFAQNDIKFHMFWVE